MAGRKIPTYRLHKATGQAVVTLSGKDYYLGKHGTPQSQQAYQRLLAEWLAGSPAPASKPGDVTVSEAIRRYLHHVEGRYGPSQHDRIVRSLAVARRLYGDVPVGEFRGRALKAVRQAIVEGGYNRRHVNHRVRCVQQCWRWLLSEELAPADAVQGVLSVPGLRQGETTAPEPERVLPVSEEVVRATLAFLPRAFTDAVKVQLASGARPGEVLAMRGEEIDRAEEALWVCRPVRHKTARRGHARTILLGPRAIDVIQARAVREGWVFPSRRRPGAHLLVSSYSHAVKQAAARAGVAHWHPHQLRHLAATLLRRDHGIEVARLILGHRHLSVTEVYAEADLSKIMDVMRKHG